MQLQAVAGPVRVVGALSTLATLIVRPAVTIPASRTLGDAVERMRAAGVSALVVGDQRGIVTERDLLWALAAGSTLDETVGRIATADPVVVPATTTVIAAAGLMLNEHLRHLLVEQEDGTISVVSIRDITALLLQAADPRLWLESLRFVLDVPSETWLG